MSGILVDSFGQEGVEGEFVTDPAVVERVSIAAGIMPESILKELKRFSLREKLAKDFNPEQPRGEDGKWSAGGVGYVRVRQPGLKGKTKKKPNATPAFFQEKPEHIAREEGRVTAASGSKSFHVSRLNRLAEVAGFEDMASDKKDSDEEVNEKTEKAIQRMTKNLLQVASLVTPERGKSAAQWYPKANEICANTAVAAGVHPDVSTAVMAVLSPGTEWGANMAMHRAVMDMHTKNPPISSEDIQRANDMALVVTKGSAKPISSEPANFRDLPTDLQARVIRYKNDVQRNGGALQDDNFLSPIDPEDPELKRPLTKKSGERASLRWQTYDNIEKACSILQDQSYENVNRSLGNAPKVRSFYNNIRDCKDQNLDVTIDTHAIGAALGLPVGVSSLEIATGKRTRTSKTRPKDGSEPKEIKPSLPVEARAVAILGGISDTASDNYGAYALGVEAYRRVAEDPAFRAKFGDVSPAQVQSILWVGWKDAWPSEVRGDSLGPVRAIMRNQEASQEEKSTLVERVRRNAIEASNDSDKKVNHGTLTNGLPPWVMASVQNSAKIIDRYKD